MTIPVTLYCWVFVGPPDDTDSVALVGLMLREVNPEIVCPLPGPVVPVVGWRFDGLKAQPNPATGDDGDGNR